MKVEAVTVCVNYAGELREVAAFNRPHFDRWVVVTRAGDHATREVCRQYSMEVLLSDDFDRDGPFNKARAINRGLAMLRGDSWQMHIDADIALPMDFDAVLADAHLDEKCIYGCDRFNVTSVEAWNRVKAKGLLARSNGWSIDMDRQDCKIGARVANREYGYTPIGFFQLWHGPTHVSHGMMPRMYPIQHGTAARTDVQHAYQWDRRRRVLIPELMVWHLEPGNAPMGANWNGRTTPAFGATSNNGGNNGGGSGGNNGGSAGNTGGGNPANASTANTKDGQPVTGSTNGY